MASGHWYSDKEIRTLGRGHSDLLRRHSRGLSFICLLLWSWVLVYFLLHIRILLTKDCLR